MLYYRRPGDKRPVHWNPGLMRFATTAPLFLYPLGCILMLVIGPREGFSWIELVGFVPIILSLLLMALVVPTYIQRLTGEVAKDLDEFEMDQRRKATTFAYRVFTIMVVLAFFYMDIVSDAAKLQWMWRPSSEGHWTALFWAAILYAILLPSAYLAWTLKPAPADEEDEGVTA